MCVCVSTQIIYTCVEYNYFDYLSLLLKYFNKNNIALKHGINYKSKYDDTVLLTLLESDYLNKREWLLLLFDICNQCKINFTKDIINQAINYINKPCDYDGNIIKKKKEEFKDGKYKLLIENEYNKLNKLLNSVQVGL